MRYRDTHQSLRALYALAASQGGYFTAKQAAGVGYDYPHLTYHLHANNFERAGHGLYRLPTIPSPEHDDLIRLTLWSRNRLDQPQAVVSHASALLLHQLSDVLPQKIHLTVPQSFRKPPPQGCTLHKMPLLRDQVQDREGFAVTTPLRTLIDAATDPGITDAQLDRAMKDALRRGMVRQSVLKKAIGEVLPSNRREHFAALMGS